MTTPTRSGFPALTFNFRERIVSDDQNRAHQFTAQAIAELLRRAHLSSASSATAGGKTSVASAVLSPARGLVFEGIRFRPEIGTVNGFVEPGCLAIVAPEASPHPADSPARLISDAGVQTAGQLVLTTGPAATRIDVVECQPLQQVVETDSRDVFDPSTGLFAPVSVNKVVQTGLAYRIRTGVDGGGFPGTASGWLPIAVCSVPSGATTWNDATVWDVRPLAIDLASPPHLTSASFPAVRRQAGSIAEESVGSFRARGLFEAELNGWRLGGELAASSSGSTFLELGAAGPNQEPGFAVVAGAIYYLYLAQPFGLPRWCRLNPSSSGNRDPGALRGIPILSSKAVVGLGATPGTPVALPTATGLGSSTSAAVAVVAGNFGSGGDLTTAAVGGDGWTSVSMPGPLSTIAPSSGNDTSLPVYTLVPGTHYPSHASTIRVRFASTLTMAAGTSATITESATIAGVAVSSHQRVRRFTVTSPASGSFSLETEVDLPTPLNFPAGSPLGGVTASIQTLASAGAPTYSATSAKVVGWKLGC